MFQRFHDWISYRELARNFVVRNLKLKYKGSVLGFVWSLLTPLLQMIVYSIVFSYIIRVQTDYPFPLFIMTGLLPWIFFSSSLTLGTHSLLENANLLRKVYFPRELIPFSAILSNMISFLLSLVVLIPLLAYYRMPIPWTIVLLPIVAFLHLLFTLGLGLILACLGVFFRDIFHILEIIMLVWFYASPIIYPINYVPERLHVIYRLNPMVDMIEMYRSFLLYCRIPHWKAFIRVGISGFGMFIVGYLLFVWMEWRVAKEV